MGGHNASAAWNKPNEGSESSNEDKVNPNQATIEGMLENKDKKQEIEEAYEEFAERTEITIRQGEKIDEKRQKIEEVLEDEFNIEEHHLFGSFVRGTMVGPLDEESDTDVMFVLDPKEHGKWIYQENGPKNCLRAIKRAIEKDPKYANTEVSIDQNVVQVKFHDFTVEIAPAFRHPEGGYQIPDTHGRQNWVRTNPREYKRRFEAIDDKQNGKLRKLTRAAKTWNEKNGKPLSSFHIEVMALRYMQNRQTNFGSQKEHIENFFRTLPSRIQQTTKEPVYGEIISGYLSIEDRSKAKEKAKEARKKIEESKRVNNTAKAKKILREVFGRKFR